MRGEDSNARIAKSADLETPPHAWGRQNTNFLGFLNSGNTPTCVGKTRHRQDPRGSRKKHPHMRGEDGNRGINAVDVKETPPHAWGRLTFSKRILRAYRNTPTCVGKTRFIMVPNKTGKKHPHMRGEDACTISTWPRRAETPPHAWGRPSSSLSSIALARNTPTCVGKTYNPSGTVELFRKHPHMRGEDRLRASRGDVPRRNTPTCVGKTVARRMQGCQ